MRRIKGNPRFYLDGDDIKKSLTHEPIPHDEPVLFLRARDHLSVPLLEVYRKMCIEDGCTDFQIKTLDETIEAFKQFQSDNSQRVKQPGITRGL